MAKTLQIMAVRKGLSVTYEYLSEGVCTKRSIQQNLARRKRYSYNDKENDDPDGPPDTNKKFNLGMLVYFRIINSILKRLFFKSTYNQEYIIFTYKYYVLLI